MTHDDFVLLSLFDIKELLSDKGIPFADDITKDQAWTLYDTSENPMFQSFAEIMAEVIEVKELIGSIIQGGCTCQLFGPSGDGKTFVAIDWSLSVATGTDWNGLPCRQGLVIYFNGEGKHGFKLRLKAWQRHHGVTGRVDFYASKQVITLDAAGVALAVAEIKRIEQQTGRKVSLIVIDTLARHLIGDENSTRDMSEFIRAVDGMREQFTDSTAVIVHHTGNNTEATGRSRGSSALKAALDVEVQCMNYTLTFTKMKDAEAPEPIDFKLQVVEVGTKENGDSITSCAVVYGEKPAKARQVAVKKVDGSNKCLLEIIEKHSTGEVEEIRPLFYAAEKMRLNDPERKQVTLRQSFSRAIIFLSEQKLITQKETILKAIQAIHGDTNDTLYRRISDTSDTHPLRGVADVSPSCPVDRIGTRKPFPGKKSSYQEKTETLPAYFSDGVPSPEFTLTEEDFYL